MNKYTVITYIVIGVMIVGLGLSKFTQEIETTSTTNTTTQTIFDINPPVITTSSEATPTPTSAGSYTMNDITQHNTEQDCYLSINNNVYNVTQYVRIHPGGRNTIIKRCGTEVTTIFARIHSNRAWDLLADYKIGSLSKATQTTTSASLNLNSIASGLTKANPDAEVIKVSPKHDFYVAKLIYNNKLYEVHIDKSGNLINQEVEDDESNWSLWDTDTDDR